MESKFNSFDYSELHNLIYSLNKNNTILLLLINTLKTFCNLYKFMNILLKQRERLY